MKFSAVANVAPSSYFLWPRTWRGAGAVELATLERWYTRKGIVGSNPTLSAGDPGSGIASEIPSCYQKARSAQGVYGHMFCVDLRFTASKDTEDLTVPSGSTLYMM
jgi:hypothetical protein